MAETGPATIRGVDNPNVETKIMRVYTNRTTKLMALVLMALPLISGCTSGSKVRLSDSALAGEPSAMWEEGKKSVETGEALVSKGEKRLNTGRKQVRDGEALIGKGHQSVLIARQEYQDASSAAGTSLTPKAVTAEAKHLKAIGKRWENSIDEIRTGNKLVEKGNKHIDKGQSEVREGRALMESGSTLMRNSQRSRLGEDLLPVPVPR